MVVLKSVGYQVEEVVDGLEVLKKLDGCKYNLVIFDFNMFNLDGLFFVCEMKQMFVYKFIFVIMLIIESGEVCKQEGKVVGICVWVYKFFLLLVLFDVVVKLVQL